MDDRRRTTSVVAASVGALVVVVLVGLLVTHDAGWHGFELHVDEVVYHAAPHWAHRVSATLQDLFAPTGGVFLTLVVAVVVLFAGRRGGPRRDGRTRPRAAAEFVVLTLVPWWATEALKLVVERPRPAIDGSSFPNSSLTWSYPSGHAASSTALVLAVLFTIAPTLRTRARTATAIVLGTVLVAAVMVSRVVLAVHYPTDVLAGPVSAAAFSALVMTLLRAGAARRADRALDADRRFRA